MPTKIIVFRAKDGRWSYCPAKYRHWSVFAMQGTFLTESAAMAAALKDKNIPERSSIVVEQ